MKRKFKSHKTFFRPPPAGLFLLMAAIPAAVFYFSFVPVFAETNGSDSQANGEKKNQLETELAKLEAEAEELDKNVQQTQEQTKTLSGETQHLNSEIKRRELEIKRFNLAIQKANLEIKNKISKISELSQKIDKSKNALAASLFLLYASGREDALSVLLRYSRISDFFASLDNIKKLQSTVRDSLGEFREEKNILNKEKEELEEFEKDQQELKTMQEVERRFLAQKKKEKDELLRLTKGKETLFQQLLQSKKKGIAVLKTQLFYLEKTGITAEDAIKFADLAAKRAGIRTAFLLALLEVETGKQFEDGVISVGTNLGTGNWKRDMYDCYVRLGKRAAAEAEKRAYFAITEKLGFEPDKMPVSRRPNYGCGGAMGPAQFLPTTWLRFETRVAELTGRNPANPWNIEDAFTAAAVFLAEAGASSQNAAGETAAAKTYLSGRPNCAKYVCRFYASRILTLAKDIDRIL